MIITGSVGPSYNSDGVSTQAVRQIRDGSVAVSEVRGRYTEQSRRGNLFLARAIVTAPVIFSTAAGTGGPLLWNGSTTVVANILGIAVPITVVSTVAAALGITGNTGQTAAPGTTTAIDSVANCYIGGASPACTAYRIGTPTVAGAFLLPLSNLHTGALTVDNLGLAWIWLDGLISVPPNAWASIAASATASTTVGQYAMVWEENPL